ncbi:MAG TPA: hypothetical protein VE136_14315 [Anaerolineales bacterium]|nr:hypothetical protein [Anaerolineales bacterium]
MSIIGPHVPVRSKNDSGLNRLLSAAVINREFRKLLLSKPDDALALGYKGERFCLEQEERELILSLQAKTLPDLAFRLAKARQEAGR